MNIWFADNVAYKFYSAETLRNEPLGGTEASVIRVARGLARRGHRVAHFNLRHPPRGASVIDGVTHAGLSDEPAFEPGVVIHVRVGSLIKALRRRIRPTRHVVWMQDLADDWLRTHCDDLDGVDVVCVSDFHVGNIRAALAGREPVPAVRRIYNPVEVPAPGPAAGKVNGRLGFFSSPHKGLGQVVALFRRIRRPGMELVVANPGYLPDVNVDDDGIRTIGALPHHRALEEIARCEVLFYPQTAYPETMGIVLAEANAVGVPVLAHAFGAAAEVLRQPGNAVFDCNDGERVEKELARLLKVEGKVTPGLDPRFGLDVVLDEWEGLLKSPPS